MSDGMNPTVTIEPAFRWTCPNCGAAQFGRMQIAELSPEERREVIEDHGFNPRTGDWVTAPETVKCAWCLRTFAIGDRED